MKRLEGFGMGSGTGYVPASTSTGAFLLAIAGTAFFSVAISIRSTGSTTIGSSARTSMENRLCQN
uniref:Uncharacterized protein n=2 Tax=Picea TaxID=3328 RepID=A0A117NJ99_PICGL|nr:hypothetical protein ABT39_MTgene1092 [Picea glauca]QHR89975.1 hypothetical protein Q903MT_gene3997 [Picea sitchensis]